MDKTRIITAAINPLSGIGGKDFRLACKARKNDCLRARTNLLVIAWGQLFFAKRVQREKTFSWSIQPRRRRRTDLPPLFK